MKRPFFTFTNRRDYDSFTMALDEANIKHSVCSPTFQVMITNGAEETLAVVWNTIAFFGLNCSVQWFES